MQSSHDDGAMMGTRRKSIIAAAVLAAVALLAFVYWMPLSPAHTGESGLPAAGSDEERIRALEVGLEALSAQVQALAAQPRSRHAGIPVTAERSERIDAQLNNPQVVEAERNRRFAGYDAAFRAEPTDPKWAPIAEQKLASVGQPDAILSIEAASPTSRNIECRSKMCRLQFTFSSAADAEDWSLAFATGTGKNLTRLQYAVEPQRDGSARVTMFGTR
jgi:hypothetical protein